MIWFIFFPSCERNKLTHSVGIPLFSHTFILLLDYKDFTGCDLNLRDFEGLYEKYGLIEEFIEIAQNAETQRDLSSAAEFALKQGRTNEGKELFRKAAKKANSLGDYEEAIKFIARIGDKKALKKAYITLAENLRPSWNSPLEHAKCARLYARGGDFVKAAKVIRDGMLANW